MFETDEESFAFMVGQNSGRQSEHRVFNPWTGSVASSSSSRLEAPFTEVGTMSTAPSVELSNKPFRSSLKPVEPPIEMVSQPPPPLPPPITSSKPGASGRGPKSEVEQLSDKIALTFEFARLRRNAPDSGFHRVYHISYGPPHLLVQDDSYGDKWWGSRGPRSGVAKRVLEKIGWLEASELTPLTSKHAWLDAEWLAMGGGGSGIRVSDEITLFIYTWNYVRL